MAKNSIFDPTKDGVKADNSGYSSNQIDKMIGESAAALIDDDASGDDTVYSSAKIYSLLPEDTATGAEVTITDACPDLPIVELQADINAVQEGTGDPSLENVRPISGWDEITITHDGIDVEISLGDNTVYGGIYNSDGTLTVTHAIIDMGSLEWIYNASTTVFWAVIPGMKRPGNLLCEEYVQSSATNIENLSDYEIWNRGYAYNDKNIVAKNSNYSAGADFKTAVTGVQLVYELATPIELTVSTLAFNTNGEGSTVISCDSGNITVTYKKLTSLS